MMFSTKNVSAFLVLSVGSTCPVHHILLELITVTVLC